MISRLESIICEAYNFVNTEFNLNIEKSKLKFYSCNEWEEFYQKNKNRIIGFESVSALYIPQVYFAHINIDDRWVVSNTLHEFFGHGLFCEHSKIGKDLIQLIENNEDINSFLNEKINPNTQAFGITNSNITNYEGFAMWLEDLLYSRICQISEEERKIFSNVPVLLEIFKEAESKITRFGFMSQLGFPKYYNRQKLIDTLKHIYNSNVGDFGNIDFIVLYGSRKPESDIDLFIVSSNASRKFFNGWLDIYELNREELQELVKNLDISVTDPLFSGTLIYGDRHYFEKLKQKVEQQPISQELIEYNIREAQKQREYLCYYKNMTRENKICLSYTKSYSVNAEQLSKGNKVLTLERVNQISPN